MKLWADLIRAHACKIKNQLYLKSQEPIIQLTDNKSHAMDLLFMHTVKISDHE